MNQTHARTEVDASKMANHMTASALLDTLGQHATVRGSISIITSNPEKTFCDGSKNILILHLSRFLLGFCQDSRSERQD